MNISQQSNNRGFTLIELLVVLAMSSILLTGIMKVFSSSQATYNVQEDVAAMQQNVRTAKMFLERDIRMAGSGAMNLQGPNATAVLPLWFENGGTSGTDRLTVIYEAPDSNACGALTAPATILCSDLPPLTLASTTSPTATTAGFAEELDDAPYSSWLTETCSCNGAVYALASSNMPFIVSTPDKSQTSILIATHISNNGGGSFDTLSNGPNVSYTQIPGAEDLYNFLGENPANGLANKQLNTLAPGSTISFFNTKSMYKAIYSVATDANGITALYRDTGDGGEVIAEHIEDFQCSFELDDGTTINNRDLTAAEIPEVRLVTINVLARSAHQHRNSYGNFSGQRMALEDNGAGPADNYRRRLLTVTVKIRNFGLN
ncbi:MAG: PilW family protein [Chloroflexi bacterium]|nr:PilW family protein [Chloroflexota bacterium]